LIACQYPEHKQQAVVATVSKLSNRQGADADIWFSQHGLDNTLGIGWISVAVAASERTLDKVLSVTVPFSMTKYAAPLLPALVGRTQASLMERTPFDDAQALIASRKKTKIKSHLLECSFFSMVCCVGDF
jgi:hypothetical protein